MIALLRLSYINISLQLILEDVSYHDDHRYNMIEFELLAKLDCNDFSQY